MAECAEHSRTQYLVGSVWPTNRTGVLGDKELDPKLPPSIRFVHLTMDFTQGNQAEFRAAMPGYEAKVAELAELGADLIRPIGAPPFMLLGYDGEAATISSWEDRYGVPDGDLGTEPRARVPDPGSAEDRGRELLPGGTERVIPYTT